MNILESMEEKEVRMRNPLVLAYIGDTIYDLYMRTYELKRSQVCVNALNKTVCARVNARAQAEAADRIEALFTEAEHDIYRRGRNAKSGTVPKNMDVQDYRKATGLEAVMGYLYLTGENERINELFEVIIHG